MGSVVFLPSDSGTAEHWIGFSTSQSYLYFRRRIASGSAHFRRFDSHNRSDSDFNICKSEMAEPAIIILPKELRIPVGIRNAGFNLLKLPRESATGTGSLFPLTKHLPVSFPWVDKSFRMR